jgi:formylglycine-generating enzyme
MNDEKKPEVKKTSSVPAGIMIIIVLLLGINGYFVYTTLVKGGRKSVVDPVSKRQEAPQASPPAALSQPPEAPQEARDQKPISTPAFNKNAVHAQTKALPGMVWIPGGKFMMGSPEGAGNADEHPQHPVMVNGFFMDTTEVTQAEYAKAMGVNPSHFKECPACPVENVSWDDAMAYCGKVGKRLPTEAQWEYACRAGSTTMTYWGDDRDEKYAWYENNSGQKTHPVGRKKPNRFGLYDMLGNVWEWCSDWYDSTYYEKRSLRNPQGPDSATHRVFRGGSWANHVSTLHSASRDWAVPEDLSSLFGFRCVSLPRFGD